MPDDPIKLFYPTGYYFVISLTDKFFEQQRNYFCPRLVFRPPCGHLLKSKGPSTEPCCTPFKILGAVIQVCFVANKY